MADRWLQIARMNQEQIGELHLAYNRAFATVIDNAGNPIAADSHITPSMRTFLETLYLQAMKDDKMLNPKIQQIVAEHGCIPSDMRAIDRYMEATPQQRWSIKLSKRAQRTMTSMNKLCGEMHDEINMLLLISPHTFCQTNTDLSDSAIQRIMEHITCPNQYNRFSGGLGGWANTPPLSVVQAGDFRVDVMGYAHLERPRLKIKIHARNTNDGLEDKLDVEEMFAGGEFAGIVHYHVEKPYTLDRLIRENKISVKEASRTKIELSRNPDNKAIIIDMGEGKKRTYKDEIGDNFVAGTFSFWRNYPEVVGGCLARQLVYVATQDPRIVEIQRFAVASLNQ